MFITNRKLVIFTLIIANMGMYFLPWYCALCAILLALFNLIKNRDIMFSALLTGTALIDATIGSLMMPITVDLHNLANTQVDMENLQITALIMVVPLLINLLFIFSFDQKTR